MDKEAFKKRNNEIWNSWVGGIISSIFGVYSVYLGFNVDWANLFGRVILILFGIFLQIPLGYFKIYKLIKGENN